MPMIGPLKLKAQLLCDHEIAMGPGKADLLEAIDRYKRVRSVVEKIRYGQYL